MRLDWERKAQLKSLLKHNQKRHILCLIRRYFPRYDPVRTPIDLICFLQSRITNHKINTPKLHNFCHNVIISFYCKRVVFTYRSCRPDVFCKQGVLRDFVKFTGKHLRQNLFFNKVAGLRLATLLKKRLWRSCFPVNFMKFRRKLFFINHLQWLLLYIVKS